MNPSKMHLYNQIGVHSLSTFFKFNKIAIKHVLFQLVKRIVYYNYSLKLENNNFWA